MSKLLLRAKMKAHTLEFLMSNTDEDNLVCLEKCALVLSAESVL